MEAIAAFSLACNVVQVVDFALKVSSKCKEIARTGSTIEIQDYENTSKQLAELTHSLNASINTTPKPLGKDDQDLLDLSRKCCRVASDLKLKLEELSVKNGKQRGTLGKAWKTFRDDRSIQDLHKRLKEYEQALNMRLLTRLR